MLRLQFGVEINGFLSQLGPIVLEPHDLTQIDWAAVNSNPFFCPNPEAIPTLEAYMDALRKDGDSIGAKITVLATGVPVGWGEPVFDRLDADLAHAFMSINAVKGVEIGDGFAVVNQKGTEHRDLLSPEGFLSNHAGGILGGISSGQDLIARLALKPTSSLRLPGQSIDIHGNACEIITTGRHDPCVGIRATPIAEAMMALVLADQALRHRGQNGANPESQPRIPARRL